MDKNKKYVNTLIKRKGLLKIIREKGIKRISKGGEQLLNYFILDEVGKVLDGVKNEMDILGKRVLDEEIIKFFINNKGKKEEIDY